MEKNSNPTLKQIKLAANILFGENIYCKYRGRDVVRKRQVCHYVAHRKFGHSLSNTGAEFGRKDHSTVLHSCKVIDSEINSYVTIRSWVNVLYKMCVQEQEHKSAKKILLELKRSKTVDPNIKVEINAVLKILRDKI